MLETDMNAMCFDILSDDAYSSLCIDDLIESSSLSSLRSFYVL